MSKCDVGEIETPLQNTIDAAAFLSRIEAIEGAQDREENCEKVQYEGCGSSSNIVTSQSLDVYGNGHCG